MKSNSYQAPNAKLWNGRISNEQLYLHEKVVCTPLDQLPSGSSNQKDIAILGYACDEGVKRNKGRIGAAQGPDVIRAMMASISNHLPDKLHVVDTGTMLCEDGNLETTQSSTSQAITQLLQKSYLPIVIGGGHDLAYAHYQGIKAAYPDQRIGIINLDAHFDLRAVEESANSGTPFYQIATAQNHIDYLCLGIQKAANNRILFETASQYHVQYLENTAYTMSNWDQVNEVINQFIDSVDVIYVTIDMDGFSSAYAPGVSAPSPLGFAPDIAFKSLHTVYASKKLVSMDIVEYNPVYDQDNCTARLAARLIYDAMLHSV